MNHEIKWKEIDVYNLMFGKMCLEVTVWEDVNCPYNKRRGKIWTDAYM